MSMTHRTTRVCVALAISLAACSAGIALAADSTNQAATPAAATNMHPPADVSWAQLLDARISLIERQRMLSTLEQSAAQNGDPHTLYLLGSLYHMGQHATSSPVQQDLNKASLYLGNAAIRGSVLAMAKMAELKLIAGQYREAMNWAQIYAHYALLTKEDRQSREAYAAELVQRVMDHIGDSQMPAIMADVSSFVAAYDASIQAGMLGESTTYRLHPSAARHRFKGPLDSHAESGIADFIVAFKPDGTSADVRLLDAVPRIDVGGMLREFAANMTVAPAADDHDKALRYAWVPTMLNDRRYRTTTRH
jgi:hypothetical protein